MARLCDSNPGLLNTHRSGQACAGGARANRESSAASDQNLGLSAHGHCRPKPRCIPAADKTAATVKTALPESHKLTFEGFVPIPVFPTVSKALFEVSGAHGEVPVTTHLYSYVLIVSNTAVIVKLDVDVVLP